MPAPATGPSQLAIDEVRIYRFDIPLKDVFTIATMSLSTAHNLLVEVRTNQGLVGWGEASSFRSIVGETQNINIAAAQELRPLLIGANPLAVRPLMEQLDAWLPHNTTLKSASTWPSSTSPPRPAACRSTPTWAERSGRWRPTSPSASGDPAQAGEKALAVKAMGFRIIKVKVGLSDAGRSTGGCPTSAAPSGRRPSFASTPTRAGTGSPPPEA